MGALKAQRCRWIDLVELKGNSTEVVIMFSVFFFARDACLISLLCVEEGARGAGHRRNMKKYLGLELSHSVQARKRLA